MKSNSMTLNDTALRTGMSVFALLVLTAGQETVAQSSGESLRAQALIAQVVDYRKRIRTGSALVSVEQPGQDSKRWRAWFKGDAMVRSDNLVYRESQIQTGGDYFEHHLDRVVSPERRPPEDPNSSILNLRLLGVIAMPTFAWPPAQGFDWFVSLFEDADLSVETVDYDGRTVELITADMGNDRVFRYWIDEERGPSIVRVEIRSNYRESYLLSTLTCELAEFDSVWFPRQMTYSRKLGDAAMPPAQTVFEDVMFNRELDDDVFSLNALNVPPGTFVHESPHHPMGRRYWDGARLVLNAPKSPGKRELQTDPVKQNGATWVVLINIVLGAGCFVTYMCVKRKKGT